MATVHESSDTLEFELPTALAPPETPNKTRRHKAKPKRSVDGSAPAEEARRDSKEFKAPYLKSRRARLAKGYDLPNVFWLVAVHLGLLAAPFFFTWQAVVLTFVLHWLTGGIGICLGYHRLFTHRSFETSKPVRWFLAWLGGLAGEGSVVHWVANHRKHHALSDQPDDPHSPHAGGWWSHMFWFTPKFSPREYREHNQRWAPDLAQERFMLFLDRTFILWHILLAFVLYGAGYLLGGVFMGWSFVVWGSFVRLAFVLHSTWFVNSASHMWGYRNYETRDDSRNNWWVALITYGEGWHNNHHALPRMARHGHRWWEVDVTFWTIRLCEKLGLFWKVVDGQHKKALNGHLACEEEEPADC